MATLLAIPDLHAPFAHPGALDFLADVKRAHKPKTVVCLGDEIDAHAFSHFNHEPGLHSAADELKKARKYLSRLKRLFPLMSVCSSNHTLRLYKKASCAGIPAECLKSIPDVLGIGDGWYWKDRWVIDGVAFQHGDGFSGADAGKRAATANRMSTVIAHVHAHAGLGWLAGPLDSIFWLSCGCLIDQDSLAFAYARSTPARPTLGCGLIVDGVPHFIPLMA